MTTEIYEAAWAVIEPIFNQYIIDAQKHGGNPTQKFYDDVHAAFVVKRDAALVPFGVSMDDLDAHLFGGHANEGHRTY